MKHHGVTRLFPPMSADQYEALKASIASIGQKEAVWVHQGTLIDGVHRERACAELGLALLTREWDGEGSLTDFVVALNRDRRHLTADQCVAIAVEIEEAMAKEARQRQKEAAARGGRSSGATRRGEAKVVANVPQPSEGSHEEPSADEKKSRTQAAEAMNVKPRRVQSQKKVKEEAPELHEKVKAGAMTHAQARAEVRRREKRADLERKATAVTANGQTTPSWEVREGDCLLELARVEAGTVRLVFADSPYNIGVDYGRGASADRLPDESFRTWCRQWMEACALLLTDDGSMWVLINDEHAAHFALHLSSVGLHHRSWIKWYETFGVNCTRKFNRCSRHLFYCVKDPGKFVFNPDPVTRPSARQEKYDDRRADPGGKLWDDVWLISRLTDTCSERLPDFPTQLPLALLEPIVLCSTEPGDLVLDPFSGSGTTGVAALCAGRRYLGIEKSERFAILSRLRLEGVEIHVQAHS